MKIKSLIPLVMLIASVSLWDSCEKDTGSDDNSGTEDGLSHEEASDYTWEESSVVDIVLKGTSVETSASGVTVNGSIATITAAGNYRVTGTLTDGRLIVDAGKTGLVRLILNGAAIANSSGTALLIESSAKTVINLAAGTQNTITDGSAYTDSGDDPNAALFSKTDLTIFGDGSLTVKGNYQDGISGKDGFIIKSGNIQVSAADDGIRGKDFLAIQGGTITVTAGDDGLKSDNDANSSVGYISIGGGAFDITAGGDGISATTDLTVTGGDFTIKTGGGSTGTVASGASAKGLKGLTSVTLSVYSCSINSADDAIHSNNQITINSGTFTIASGDDAIHADTRITVNSGDITVTKAYEGLESHYITINDGNLDVSVTDDGLNATAGTRTEQDDKSFVYIYGGHIRLNASTGDPLDSNGSIVMTNGTVIIHGPQSEPEVGFDYNGTFNISGGFLVASGTSSMMTQAPSNSSTQNSVKITYRTSQSASTLFHIQDADGNDVATFQPVRRYQSMVISSPALVKGSTYSVYKGGSTTGTNDGGLYSGGAYTPGSLLKEFTVTGSVTGISNL